ncbi:ubiquitin domain-containing protein 7SL RNA1-like [Solanum dulcamara]|uniref:ubiquitin domain-containing protein 7SL RNA1-like n=1 Tax=Solanum dulcamara TaxID=45834 RepID=UPI0024855B59|nr:ubiquitin domain-containing protein 7SL RNA1-like [Solanum dulcamara]
MDVFIQPTKGRSFAIEVGYFDTILEIKDKIQRDQGIPIPKQTLIFKGNVLEDHLNVHYSDILDRSYIQLVVESEPDKNYTIKAEQQSSSSQTRKIQLLLKMPTSKLGVALEADVTDSIWRVKERIHDMEGVHVNKLVMRANGIELIDHQTLQNYGLSDNSEIDVSIKASTIIVSAPTTTIITTTSSGSSVNNNGNGSGFGSKKLRIMILSKCGTKKIPIEVNPLDNVGHLRKELQTLELELPQEGYFFIYKQNVMDDDRSFRWHHVCQGDTIEIFNGSVTGGV